MAQVRKAKRVIQAPPSHRSTYKAVEMEFQDKRDKQLVSYNYSYALNLAVPNNSQRVGSIVVDNDADFFIERITGSAYGPTDENGVRLLNEPTDFPLAGTTQGYADRGLFMEIRSKGAVLDLTDGFIALETVLTPGYDTEFHIPYPYKFYVRRNTTLNFTFSNRDTATPNTAPELYHFVNITLNGYKYTGESR